MAILIISEYNDATTDLVIDWILFYKKIPIRLTFEDFMQKFEVSIFLSNDQKVIKVINKELNAEIESVWFRMDTKNYFANTILEKKHKSNKFNEIYKFLTKEILTAKQIFLNDKSIKWLSDYETVSINKYNVLEKAKRYELLIPETIVTNNKKDLLDFININNIESIICKSIAENLTFLINDSYCMYQPIKVLSQEDILSIPEMFLPSLFQNFIKKDFDIRVFYLNGEFYSTSIYSELTDYREDNKTVRYNPIKLPSSLEKKICLLMNHLNLNTGSLDFIKEKNSTSYYFLEINPNGHFGYISDLCNYFLEEKIAKFLCHE